VTHKIAPNIDQERDQLMDGLNQAQMVTSIYQMKGIGPTLNGRNGEGDPITPMERYGWRGLRDVGRKLTRPPKDSRRLQ
jgi:LssY C-terminus